MIVNLLVEGDLDAAVGTRLLHEADLEPGTVYGQRGVRYIRDRVAQFARAAVHVPLLVLVDFMDTDLPCPPDVARRWLPQAAPGLLLRVAVPEIESWLIADRAGVASFLHVSVDRVPREPEMLADPKQTLVNLARRSRSRRIRDALVPQPQSSALVGRLYNSELGSFVRDAWDPGTAAEASASLARCRARLHSLAPPRAVDGRRG